MSLKSRAVTAMALICSVSAVSARADAVLDWNGIMQTTLVGQSAMNETRIAAITQLAVFEAVNAITREYQPYLGTVTAPRSGSTEAAAVAAAHGVLRFYMPAKAQALDESRATSLTAIVNGPAKDSGIAVGEAAAAAMIALRSDDGSTPARSYLPTSNQPGEWQLTASCSATGGVAAHWGEVQPFGIETATRFRLDPPPALTSKRYAQSYNETKRVGGQDSIYRPQDRADVARYYAVVLTIRTWNPVATQLAMAQGRSSTHTARALALLNMAMSDALVAVFDSKYHYHFWRPETAIRGGDTDGNWRTTGDGTFMPFINPPCHPSYGSAHASAGYAARTVLERIYGPRHHSITLTSAVVPDVTLHYSSIRKITDDIDDARVYGGIHFRFDQEAGARLGNRIGTYVYWNNLTRRHRHHSEW